jgi:hypothetical protein
MVDYMGRLGDVVNEDVVALRKARESYGDSWKKRGGVGAYMMLARKIDRLENQAEKHHYDIFAAAAADTRPEGIIDDIRDLRRYLILVEAEIIDRRQNSLAGIDEMRDRQMKALVGCDCGATMGQSHRYGCAAHMGGGENG